MTYLVLARKLRPRTFGQVVGQGHIVQSLINVSKRKEYGHAYLFTGTRGVGKTSMARIFSKAIRCENRNEDVEPCLICPSCKEIEEDRSIDVLEVDGASHNSVQHIRQLVENVHYLPVKGKYKIYIIDEVHMLTKEAFNALLKTLEAPPSHVIFMFATTMPNKLLDTVMSRCQRFDLRHISAQQLEEYLIEVCHQEEIKYDNVSLLKIIANEAKGSIRDALSMLDQVLSYESTKMLHEDSVRSALGLARQSDVQHLVQSIFQSDVSNCMLGYRKLMNENVGVDKLSQMILNEIYNALNFYHQNKRLEYIEGEFTSSEIFWIFESLAKDLSWSINSICSERVTEIVLQKICLRRSFFQSISEDDGKDKDIEQNQPGKVEKNISTNEPSDENERPQETILQEDVLNMVNEEIILNENKEINVYEKPQISELLLEDNNSIPPMVDVAPKVIMKNNITSEETHKQWEEFLNFLNSRSKTLAANLEQGNIISIDETEESYRFILAFYKSGSIFMEYLTQRETLEKLKDLLAEHFQASKSTIEVDFQLKSKDVKSSLDDDFKTMAEIKEKRNSDLKKQKENDFLNSPAVKAAQDIFSSKIDKIILSQNFPQI